MSDAHSIEDVRKSVRVYLIVFASLAVLTVVTVAVSLLHLPIVPALILALLIASIKGGLVAAYFMHLISERRVIYGTLIGTGIFLFFMFLLFIVAHGDHAGVNFVY